MHHLTRDEIVTLLSDSRLLPWQRLMFKVCLWHGLRVTELTTLTRDHLKDGYLIVQRLKGSMRTIQAYQAHSDPLLDEASELRELERSLSPGQRLFDITPRGVNKLMERVGKRTGLPRHKMHAHIFKHSIAMLTIHKAGIEHVRQHLGHKSLSSTGAYLRVTDDAASSAISGAMAA